MAKESAYAQAEKELLAGDPEKALAFCAEVPAGHKDALDAAALAAECLAELGRWEEADARAATILREDPQWAVGHLIRGLAAIEDGDYVSAAKKLLRAWDEDDELFEAAVALAALADFEAHYEEADEWLRKAHDADDEQAGPFHVDAASLDELLLEVIDEYEGESEAVLEESRFRILPMPSKADLKRGASLTGAFRIDELDPEGDPPSFGLTIYQRNLERGLRSKTGLKTALDEAVTTALSAVSEAAKTQD